uniref:Regulator of G protein signaling 2 n=1 Tax=Neogobius melanostomus TaxID=47308 RepID=A0A8C6UZ66_9GOBI
MRGRLQIKAPTHKEFTDNMEINAEMQGIKRKSWKNRITLLLKKNKPHRMKRKSHWPNTDDVLLWGQSLDHLLSHKYGRAAFLVFLKSEFCEENLEFWWKCEEFRILKSHKELESRAQSIYQEFVQSEAPKEINLDYQTRNGVMQSLPEPTPSLFIAAQRKVYSLMENNAYPRFIQSDFYRNLCATSKGGTKDCEKSSTI